MHRAPKKNPLKRIGTNCSLTNLQQTYEWRNKLPQRFWSYHFSMHIKLLPKRLVIGFVLGRGAVPGWWYCSREDNTSGSTATAAATTSTTTTANSRASITWSQSSTAATTASSSNARSSGSACRAQGQSGRTFPPRRQWSSDVWRWPPASTRAPPGINTIKLFCLDHLRLISWPICTIRHIDKSAIQGPIPIQCDQIGWFFKLFGNKFAYKSSPNIMAIFGLL